MSDDLFTVLERAKALLTDEVRADPEQWQALVHPDFFQFGFGGSEVTFDDLHRHLEPLDGGVDMDVVACEQLASDVILVRWKGRSRHGVVNRGSVWVKSDAGWQLRYQQGTLARG